MLLTLLFVSVKFSIFNTSTNHNTDNHYAHNTKAKQVQKSIDNYVLILITFRRLEAVA